MNKRGRPPKGVVVPSELPDLIALWAHAAGTPHGIIVASSRPNALLQRLYSARREVGGFEDLRLVEDTNCVWIVPRA